MERGGVPARVGVGFLPGSYTGADYVVSTKDAHAWVEAEIPGAGWTNFDPTPGRGTASAHQRVYLDRAQPNQWPTDAL